MTMQLNDPAAPGSSEVWRLLLENDTLHEFLSGLAAQAAKDTAGALSCGVTVRRGPRQVVTFGSSDVFAERLDEIQYTVDTGPCLEALRIATTIEVDDATSEQRWKEFVSRATSEGVRASLSVPILNGGVAVGALNLYARHPRVFTDDDRAAASSFAAQAAGALVVALRLSERAALAVQLRDAMRARYLIDQATGVIMGQRRCSAEEAFGHLRRTSQVTNTKLRDVAAKLIIESTGSPAAEPPEFT